MDMKIKERIALQFTLLVAAVLLLFSLAIYSVSEHYRQEEFYDRLKSRAETTCRLLVKVKGIDKDLLKAIDQNTLSEMLDEKVLIFDRNNDMVYSSVDDKLLTYQSSLLDEVREKVYIEFHQGENEVIGLLYEDESE